MILAEKLTASNQRNQTLVAQSEAARASHEAATAELTKKLAAAEEARDEAKAFFDAMSEKLNSTEQQLVAVTKQLQESALALSKSEEQRQRSEQKLQDFLAAQATQEQSSSSDAEESAEDEDAATSAE